MGCEDYPFCGHESTQDCHDAATAPEGYLPLRCVECGERIKRGQELDNVPSMHAVCAEEYSRNSEMREPGYDPGPCVGDY